jgi:hypothetical protein
MVFADLITKWSHQTVYIQHATSSWDSQGNPVLSTSSANTVLVQYVTRAVMDRNGTQKVSSCQILFPASASMSIDDSIVLPDGTNPEIISIEKNVDFDGNTEYIKVFT